MSPPAEQVSLSLALGTGLSVFCICVMLSGIRLSGYPFTTLPFVLCLLCLRPPSSHFGGTSAAYAYGSLQRAVDFRFRQTDSRRDVQYIS